jgi:predicted ribosome quality control (RQC) complex YloA/Tae2 family protein
MEQEYERPKDLADLLMANVHNYKGRAESMTVEDFSGTGTLVTIPIDPMKGAVITAQALYKRSGKLKRSAAAIEPLLVEAREELAYLEQMEVTVEQAQILGEPPHHVAA